MTVRELIEELQRLSREKPAGDGMNVGLVRRGTQWGNDLPGDSHRAIERLELVGEGSADGAPYIVIWPE